MAAQKVSLMGLLLEIKKVLLMADQKVSQMGLLLEIKKALMMADQKVLQMDLLLAIKTVSLLKVLLMELPLVMTKLLCFVDQMELPMGMR